MNDTSTLTFLEQLRAATGASHQRLEALPVSASITSPSIVTTDYIHYLKLMHAVMADTERQVFPIVATLFDDLELRRKTRLIESDLADFEAKAEQPEPVFKDDFSLPFALGMFYTVEGSALGGRFILKNVEAHLGLTAEHGARYFAGYGNHTGSFWKKFLNVLTEYETESGHSDEIIAGANYAFDAIAHHFSSRPRS